MTVNATAIMSVAVDDYATCFLAVALLLISLAMAGAVKRATIRRS